MRNNSDLEKEASAYVFYATVGGSMFPSVLGGEQIVVKKVDPQNIRVGQIILFSDQKGKKIAHRVASIKEKQGQLVFQTKGDGHEQYDAPITTKQLIGRVVLLKRKNHLFVFPLKKCEQLTYWLNCYALLFWRMLVKTGNNTLRLLAPNLQGWLKRRLHGY